jgi:dolichyl-diphosphooligosaccharide--protein glycosyltransferase
MLIDSGRIWGLSVRIRSLFIKHTKTGNPLVDSVAEHQSTPRGFYMQYLHMASYWAPAGVLVLLYDYSAESEEEDLQTAAKKGKQPKQDPKQEKPKSSAPKVSDAQRHAQIFVLLFNFISIYFAGTMVRLILLVAPAASCTGAIGFVRLSTWAYGVVIAEFGVGGIMEPQTVVQAAANQRRQRELVQQRERQRKNGGGADDEQQPFWEDEEFRTPRLFIAGFLLLTLVTGTHSFQWHCRRMAVSMSHPSIMMKARDPTTGEIIIYDDFREAYWWLRDNTPEDSRVMAWWDYGYQINGVANRTTIADGNTWNHEHIALLGRALTGNEERGYGIARHLADYVLVWTTRYAGIMGDDLAKSPHMARIASSVYKVLATSSPCFFPSAFGMHTNEPFCNLYRPIHTTDTHTCFFLSVNSVRVCYVVCFVVCYVQDIDASEYRMNHQTGEATPMMKASLLYRLHNFKLNPTAGVDKLTHFEEAYTSKHQMVRIYKVDI